MAIFDEDGIRISSTKNVSSDGNVVFNFPTLFAIETGVLQTLTVKASVPVGGMSSVFYLGISASSDILSDASAVNGTFPINGNPMNILGVTVGSATIAAAGDLAPTVSFGEDDVLLADFDIDVGTAEDLLFSAIRFRNGGTNDDSLASNLRLICDGEEVSTTELEDRHADFSISNLLLEKSDTITCEVRGDIGTGSIGNTIQLYLKYDSDVTILCKNTGLRADVDTALLNTIAEAQTVTLAAGDFTIDFDRSSATGTPNQELRPDTNNVVLATLKLTSNAENTTIEAITGDASDQFEIQGAGLAEVDITAGSVEMRDVDTGAIYDLAEEWQSDTEWYLSMTEEISLVEGVTKTFEIRLDLTSSIGDEDTLKIVLEGAAMTITGDVSGEDINDILPSSITSGISTVEISSLTVTTTTLTNVSLVAGATDVIIYQGSMEAGDSSLVTLKTVTISEVSADTYTAGSNVALFSDTNITKLDLYLDGDLMKTRSNRIAEAATDGDMGSITFSSLDTNNVISAGATVSLVLKATFASTLNAAGTFALGITSTTTDVISRDVDNDLIEETITSATTETESRTVALATVGTLKVELLTTDTRANKAMYTVAGSSGPSGRYLGELVFTTANEPVMVTELRLAKNGTATTDDLASISLVDDLGDVVITQAVKSNGNVEFTNADLEFPADTATSYFIVANTKGINVLNDPTSTATSGRTIQYHIANITDDGAGMIGVVAEGVDSSTDITMGEDEIPVTLTAWGNGTAAWSTAEKAVGTYSVKMSGGLSATKVLYGETLSTLEAIDRAAVIFNFYFPASGSPPYAALWLDTTGNGVVDAILVKDFNIHDPDNPDVRGTWVTSDLTLNLADPWKWQPWGYDGSDITADPTVNEVSYTSASDYKTLEEWVAVDGWDGFTVVYIAYGYVYAETTYVDDITIDDVTYAVEKDIDSDTDEWSNALVVSRPATILGGAVTFIENDMADGALIPGTGKIIGKYEVSIDTGSNRNSDNTPMEVILTKLYITPIFDGFTVTNIKAYIEGDSSNKTDAGITGTTATEATMTFSQLDGDAEKVTGDIVLVIVADLSAMTTDYDYLQTVIADLVGTDRDLEYTDSSDQTTSNSGGCFLTISEVIGASFSL